MAGLISISRQKKLTRAEQAKERLHTTVQMIRIIEAGDNAIMEYVAGLEGRIAKLERSLWQKVRDAVVVKWAKLRDTVAARWAATLHRWSRR